MTDEPSDLDVASGVIFGVAVGVWLIFLGWCAVQWVKVWND